jgi:hypothetical protein
MTKAWLQRPDPALAGQGESAASLALGQSGAEGERPHLERIVGRRFCLGLRSSFVTARATGSLTLGLWNTPLGF